jgi:hypothetical protein
MDLRPLNQARYSRCLPYANSGNSLLTDTTRIHTFAAPYAFSAANLGSFWRAAPVRVSRSLVSVKGPERL